jgi:transposase
VARAQAAGSDAKKKSLRAAEQDRPDVKQQRAQWWPRITRVNPRKLVFLDESGAQTNLTRLYARGPRGQRVCATAPAGHWQTTTMLSAIRHDRVAAAMVVHGPTDRLVFQGFLDWQLLPILRRGDIVVLDNLSSHKPQAVIDAITARKAAVWYLPPYSPDFNPIERMWSKVKQQLRSAAARAPGSLVTAIGHALRTVTPRDLRGWFQHCGYGTAKRKTL